MWVQSNLGKADGVDGGINDLAEMSRFTGLLLRPFLLRRQHGQHRMYDVLRDSFLPKKFLVPYQFSFIDFQMIVFRSRYVKG